MTKYVPKHMAVRASRAESARMGAVAIRGGRTAVAMGAASALPLAGAALIAAPAMADETPAPAPTDTKPILSFGSQGQSVVDVQTLVTLVRDGVYGPVTTAAVKEFQSANNLDVDGVVGPKTWAALGKASTKLGSAPGSWDALLENGDQGPVVRSLQKALGLSVTGTFDKTTEAAVRAFQTQHQLLVDGIVGPQTSTALAQNYNEATGLSVDAPAQSSDSKSDAKAADAKPSDAQPSPTRKPVAKPVAKPANPSKPATAPKTPAKPAAPVFVDPNAMYELPFPAGTSYFVTQGPFGATSHHKWNDMHAVDFGLPTGSSVVAAASGTVYAANYDVTGGNNILIRDASGYCTEYAHLSSFNVSVGQHVSQGQQIALSGATGVGITGPHLHFDIVDCSTLASIKIADTKEMGISYVPGVLAVSRNGA